MNGFMDILNDDLNDVFFNTDEFGLVVGYVPYFGAETVEINAIFDAQYTTVNAGFDGEMLDKRPHITCREIDMVDGEIKGEARFIISGITYRPADDASNLQGVIRCFLNRCD